MTQRPLVVAAVALLLSACSSSSSPPASGGTEPDAGATTLAPPPSGQGIQLEMQTTIAGSAEDERCKFVQVKDDLWINDEVIRYTPGSHHFLIWSTTYTSIPTMNTSGVTVDTTQVFQCLGGPPGDWKVDRMVGGSQSASAASNLSGLPAGVALHIPAGTVLMLDLHVLNASPKPLDTTVLANLLTIPKASVQQEAGVYFFYNPFIRVPASGTSSARMSCPVTSDVKITTMQSHMHKQGLGGTATLEDSTGASLGQLYTSNTWADPPTTVWKSGKALTPGQQIDYECHYDNQGTTDVVQGFSAAKNEMCVISGAYYPRDTKFETCGASGTFSGESTAATYIGTGTSTCTEMMVCAQNSKPFSQDQGDSFFGCVVDTCPGAAKAMTSFIDCVFANSSNVQAACKNEISACIAQGC